MPGGRASDEIAGRWGPSMACNEEMRLLSCRVKRFRIFGVFNASRLLHHLQQILCIPRPRHGSFACNAACFRQSGSREDVLERLLFRHAVSYSADCAVGEWSQEEAAGSFATEYGCWESAVEVSRQVQLFRALNSVQTDFKAGTDALEEASGGLQHANMSQIEICRPHVVRSSILAPLSAPLVAARRLLPSDGCVLPSSDRSLEDAQQIRNGVHTSLAFGHRTEVFRAL